MDIIPTENDYRNLVNKNIKNLNKNTKNIRNVGGNTSNTENSQLTFSDFMQSFVYYESNKKVLNLFSTIWSYEPLINFFKNEDNTKKYPELFKFMNMDFDYSNLQSFIGSVDNLTNKINGTELGKDLDKIQIDETILGVDQKNFIKENIGVLKTELPKLELSTKKMKFWISKNPHLTTGTTGASLLNSGLFTEAIPTPRTSSSGNVAISGAQFPSFGLSSFGGGYENENSNLMKFKNITNDEKKEILKYIRTFNDNMIQNKQKDIEKKFLEKYKNEKYNKFPHIATIPVYVIDIDEIKELDKSFSPIMKKYLANRCNYMMGGVDQNKLLENIPPTQYTPIPGSGDQPGSFQSYPSSSIIGITKANTSSIIDGFINTVGSNFISEGFFNRTQKLKTVDFVENNNKNLFSITDDSISNLVAQDMTNIIGRDTLEQSQIFFFAALGLITDTKDIKIDNVPISQPEFNKRLNVIANSVGKTKEDILDAISKIQSDLVAGLMINLGFILEEYDYYDNLLNVKIPLNRMISVKQWIDNLKMKLNYGTDISNFKSIVEKYTRDPNQIGFLILEGMVNYVNALPQLINKKIFLPMNAKGIGNKFTNKLVPPVNTDYILYPYYNPFPVESEKKLILDRTKEIICGTEKVEKAIKNDMNIVSKIMSNSLNNPNYRTPVNRRLLATVMYGNKLKTADNIYGGNSKNSRDILNRLNQIYGFSFYDRLIAELISYLKSYNVDLKNKNEIANQLDILKKSQNDIVETICELVDKIGILNASKGLINVDELSKEEIQELQKYYESANQAEIQYKKNEIDLAKLTNLIGKTVLEELTRNHIFLKT